MTMHLLPPMFSTTGKKKGKQKHRSAEAANKARRNAESWQQLMEKYNVKEPSKTMVAKTGSRGTTAGKSVVNPRSDWRSRVSPSRLTDHIPSRDSGVGVAVKPQEKVYTGTAMIGIGQLHKSNAVPVFKKDDAEDLAKMRR